MKTSLPELQVRIIIRLVRLKDLDMEEDHTSKEGFVSDLLEILLKVMFLGNKMDESLNSLRSCVG